ncbi:MAG: hypothetical protein J7M26_04440 [Armatimonadetes bacterium]|nr:hypothetical protein [Armatimonadota bacterium]
MSARDCRRLVCAVSLVALAAMTAVSASAAETTSATPVVVVCLGDSVTYGAGASAGQKYPDYLQALCDHRYGKGAVKVINAGIGGNTSAQGLVRLDKDVLAHTPSVVLVYFGLNDSVKGAPGRYRVPPDDYEANLREIVSRCRAAGALVVLGRLTPVVPELYYQRHPRQNYAADGGIMSLLSEYDRRVVRIGRDEAVAVADLWYAFAGREEKLLRTPQNSGARDGVHPTPEGYRTLAQAMFRVLAPLLDQARLSEAP